MGTNGSIDHNFGPHQQPFGLFAGGRGISPAPILKGASKVGGSLGGT